MNIITREDFITAAQTHIKTTVNQDKLDAFFREFLPQCHAFKVDRNYRVTNRYVVDSDRVIVSALRDFTPEMFAHIYDELALSADQIGALHQQYKQEAATLRKDLTQALALGTLIETDVLTDLRDNTDRYTRITRRMQNIERDLPAGSAILQVGN